MNGRDLALAFVAGLGVAGAAGVASRRRGSRNLPPPLVYHGTAGVLDAMRVPAFFTSNRGSAAWFAGERARPGVSGRIYAVQLVLKNPFDLSTAAGFDALVQIARDAGVAVETEPYFEAPEIRKHAPYGGDNVADLVYVPAVRVALLRAGYDGVYLFDLLENDEIPTWIALVPESVRIVSSQEVP